MPYIRNLNKGIFNRLNSILQAVNPFGQDTEFQPTITANAPDFYSEGQVFTVFTAGGNGTLGVTTKEGDVYVTAIMMAVSSVLATGAETSNISAICADGVTRILLEDNLLAFKQPAVIEFPNPIKLSKVANNIILDVGGSPDIVSVTVFGYQM